MAAPLPDWPLGLGSPRQSRDVVGIWRPLIAVVAAFVLPALVALALLSVAGTGGEGVILRQHLLWWLYAQAASPALAWLSLPVTWPLLAVMVLRGWAGLCTCMALAVMLGIPVVHVLLHGDLTSEDGTVLPHLTLALAIQGATGWAVIWALLRRRISKS